MRIDVLGGAGDLVSKVISSVIIGATPFRVLITLLVTYLLSPLPLQVCSGELEQGTRVPSLEQFCLGFRV